MIVIGVKKDEEIWDYFQNDYENIHPVLKKYKKDFRKRVLNEASKYPYKKMYRYKSKENINYKIVFEVDKRGEHNNPKYTLAAIYDSEGKIYMVDINVKDGFMKIHPPHFFSRYRSRIIKNDDISTIELIEHFLLDSDAGMTVGYITEKYRPMFRKFNDAGVEEDFDIMAVSDRYCFLGKQKRNGIFVYKTIITDDMMDNDQKEYCCSLRKNNRQYMNNYYGK